MQEENATSSRIIVGPNWKVLQPTKDELDEAIKYNYYRTNEAKTCYLCGVKFFHGRSNARLCNCHKILVNCKQCGKEFELNLQNLSGTSTNRMIQSIKNNLEITSFCSKQCRYQFVNSTEKMKNQAKQNCNKINNITISWCDICKRKTNHNGYGNCMICLRKNIDYSNLGYHLQFCKICNKKTMHNGIYCCICNSNKNGQYGANGKISKGFPKEMFIFDKKNISCNENCQKFKDCKFKSNNLFKNKFGYCKLYIQSWGYKPNFINKDNVRYYKGIEVNEFVKKILSGELDINQYPGINIRFGKVCYGTEDILISEKLIKNNSNFEEKDNVLYFYDRSIQDYIPWEDYKKKFIIRSKEYTNISNILPDFKLYPTFRKQDSNLWSDGSKSAFEQSLVDDDILWFIYIKFYLDAKNNPKPLVCGKSGSLLVNSNGSDLSFSTDINDGPARRFLAENSGKYLWDKTKVAILPCKSEQEAYKLENKYTELLNLFGS